MAACSYLMLLCKGCFTNIDEFHGLANYSVHLPEAIKHHAKIHVSLTLARVASSSVAQTSTSPRPLLVKGVLRLEAVLL